MSQKASPFRIGLFVLVGLGIAVGAILVAGSGQLFARTVPLIAYFERSVNGLVVGAPVKFKGVPVGQVTMIQIAYDDQSIRQYIPVLFELDRERVVTASGRQLDLEDRAFMKAQVEKGFRATLEIESLISGRLYVQLDYFEYAPEPVMRDRLGQHVEVPTISTGLPEFVESLAATDLAGLAVDLRSLLRSMNQMVGELQIATIRDELLGTLAALQASLNSAGLSNGLQSLTSTSDELQVFLRDARPAVGAVKDDLSTFTAESAATLVELRRTLEELRRVMGPDSPLLAQAQETLVDLSEASQSVRRFADAMERTPSALLTGREPAPGVGGSISPP